MAVNKGSSLLLSSQLEGKSSSKDSSKCFFAPRKATEKRAEVMESLSLLVFTVSFILEELEDFGSNICSFNHLIRVANTFFVKLLPILTIANSLYSRHLCTHGKYFG